MFFKRNSFSIFKNEVPKKEIYTRNVLNFPSVISLQKTVILTDGPILRSIITFAIPIVISNIFLNPL